MNYEFLIKDISDWIYTRVLEANCEGVVFGLSGGVDSAVIAGLSKLAFPQNSLGIIMPCHSDIDDEIDARLVSESLNLDTEYVNLSKTFDCLIEASKEASNFTSKNKKLALANIKPRLRMTTLYYYAQNLNYLVLGPTNKSEFMMGYFTKHGDSSVDLLPIADLLKRDIFKIAKLLNIPQKILNKKPSAGLWEEQSDEDEMGFSYELLDSYISDDSTSIDDSIKKKIDSMYYSSRHKRTYPPIYKVRSDKNGRTFKME